MLGQNSSAGGGHSNTQSMVSSTEDGQDDKHCSSAQTVMSNTEDGQGDRESPMDNPDSSAGMKLPQTVSHLSSVSLFPVWSVVHV